MIMILLVIEIKIPDLSEATGSTAINTLIHTVPHILSYITSFLVIGVLWLNHHALFHLLKWVDRIALTINLVLLMCIAFLPLPTAALGEYGKLQPIVMFHGLTLLLTGIVYNILWFYVVRQYLWGHQRSRSPFHLSSFSLEY